MSKARYYGINPPFVGGTQKIFSRQEDLRLIKNDILQLLLTIPGERVHRPTFGCQLRATVFDLADSTTLMWLNQDITQAIGREEPRVTDVKVFLDLDQQGKQLNATVTCRLTFDPSVQLQIDAKLKFPGE